MRPTFGFFVLLIFCLSAFAGPKTQNHKFAAKLTPDTCSSARTSLADSIANTTIQINGQQNTVSINNNHPIVKNLKTVASKERPDNSIQINGEGNAVNIHQNGKDGRVNIQQNGNGNKVTVSQTHSEK